MKTYAVYDPVVDTYYEWKEGKEDLAYFIHEPFLHAADKKDCFLLKIDDSSIKDIVLNMRLKRLSLSMDPSYD